MKVKVDWKEIKAEADLYKSLYSKKDLTYLITKFLLNNDDSQVRPLDLKKHKTSQLYIIWEKNRPDGFYIKNQEVI